MAKPDTRNLSLDTIIGTLLSILLPALFFWQLWTPTLADRRAIVTGDFTHQYYPLRAFAARQLATGHLPLWNPHIYGGQPGLADPQMAVLYPPNLLTALLLGNRFSLYILEWQVIFHFMLASLFMFWFVRRRTGHLLPGLIAAFAFTFGGYLTSFPVQQVTILETAVWLPLILLFLDWGLDGESRGQVAVGAIAAGLALAIAILAGHPQTALYLFYVAAVFALWRWYRKVTAGDRATFAGRAADALRAYGALLLFPLVALGAAAGQLLPTVEFIALSSRQAANYTFASPGLAWHELTVALLPNFFGGSPLYAGIVTLALAGLALLATQSGRERWLWAGLALGSLMLALGGNSFLYGLFYLGVPGFARVRDQERVLLVFSFAVAMLAGMAAAALLDCRRGLGRRLRLLHRWWGRAWLLGLLPAGYLYVLRARALAGAGGDAGVLEGFLDRYLYLLVLGALVWASLWGLRRSRNTRHLLTLLALLLLFDLFSVNWRYNLGQKSPPDVFPPSAAVAWLQGHGGDGRVASAGTLEAGDNAGLIYDWEDTTGNDPLRLWQTVQFARNVGTWQRWQLWHVAFVVSRKPMHDDGLSFRFNDDRVAIYALDDPFPRAWLTRSVSVAENDSAAWDALNDPQVDLRRTAVIGREDAQLAVGLEGERAPEVGRVTVRGSEGDRLGLDVEAVGDALLVISQVYYPGWVARVDGEETPLFRVDGLLQGVAVPAGTHQVEIRFRPLSFRLGLAISGLTLLFCAIVLLLRATKL